MLRKLKVRFILLSMVSMTATLVIAFTAVNITLWARVTSRTDQIIDYLYENGGSFPVIGDSMNEKLFHDETPFQTRYYVVIIKGGEYSGSNYSHISLDRIKDIDEQIANILKQNKERGYIDNSRYGCFDYDDGKMLIVLDCHTDLILVNTLLTITLVTILSCVVIVFILLTVFSKYVIKPFEENREKQRRFITDAGHELKTPIAIIQSNTEVMEMIEGENKWLGNIKAQTVRMSKLVKGLIELSKMDEQVLSEKEKQKIDLSEIVSNSVESFIVPAQAKGIEIKTDIDDEVTVMGDLEDIVRLVGILLDNAVKYTDDRHLIEVGLKRKSKKVYLTVSNTCKGIDRESVPKFFDRFYRSDKSRNSQTGGYGIGLSMAQMIVQNHKGKISVSYTDDEKIVFITEL